MACPASLIWALGLGGQPDVFARQLFGAGQVGRRAAHLFEQGGRSAARLGHLHPDSIECIGGGLIMLVRRQAVFLMSAQKGVDATGGIADLLEFLGQGLVVLDVLLGLRLGDRQVFDHFRQPLSQRRPVRGRARRIER